MNTNFTIKSIIENSVFEFRNIQVNLNSIIIKRKNVRNPLDYENEVDEETHYLNPLDSDSHEYISYLDNKKLENYQNITNKFLDENSLLNEFLISSNKIKLINDCRKAKKRLDNGLCVQSKMLLSYDVNEWFLFWDSLKHPLVQISILSEITDIDSLIRILSVVIKNEVVLSDKDNLILFIFNEIIITTNLYIIDNNNVTYLNTFIRFWKDDEKRRKTEDCFNLLINYYGEISKLGDIIFSFGSIRKNYNSSFFILDDVLFYLKSFLFEYIVKHCSHLKIYENWQELYWYFSNKTTSENFNFTRFIFILSIYKSAKEISFKELENKDSNKIYVIHWDENIYKNDLLRFFNKLNNIDDSKFLFDNQSCFVLDEGDYCFEENFIELSLLIDYYNSKKKSSFDLYEYLLFFFSEVSKQLNTTPFIIASKFLHKFENKKLKEHGVMLSRFYRENIQYFFLNILSIHNNNLTYNQIIYIFKRVLYYEIFFFSYSIESGVVNKEEFIKQQESIIFNTFFKRFFKVLNEMPHHVKLKIESMFINEFNNLSQLLKFLIKLVSTISDYELEKEIKILLLIKINNSLIKGSIDVDHTNNIFHLLKL